MNPTRVLVTYEDYSDLSRAWAEGPIAKEQEVFRVAAEHRDAYQLEHPDNPLKNTPRVRYEAAGGEGEARS